MAKYNLSSSLETSFTFEITTKDGVKEYSFRKPTVREMREVAKTFSGIDKEQDAEKQVEMSDQAMAELYGFIEPVGHDTPVAEVLDEQTIDVQKAFNEMIKTELGAN